MAELIMLITPLDELDPPGAVAAPAGFEVRPCDPSDLHQLADLYFEAYDPGVACDTLDYRRRGLARLAIRYGLATFKQAGETTVALGVAHNNTPAHTLYESLGFAATLLSH